MHFAGKNFLHFTDFGKFHERNLVTKIAIFYSFTSLSLIIIFVFIKVIILLSFKLIFKLQFRGKLLKILTSAFINFLKILQIEKSVLASTKSKNFCYSTVQTHSSKEKYGYTTDEKTGHTRRDPNIDGFLKIGMVSFPEPLKESMKEFYNSKYWDVYIVDSLDKWNASPKNLFLGSL